MITSFESLNPEEAFFSVLAFFVVIAFLIYVIKFVRGDFFD